MKEVLKKCFLDWKVILALLCLALLVISIPGSNDIIAKNEKVNFAYAQVQTMVERKSALIPQLIDVVKESAKHEETIFDSILQIQSKISETSTIEELLEVNAELTDAIASIVDIASEHPELTVSAQYVALMDEITGSENRIAIAKMDYNIAVSDYNATIKKFPGYIWARLYNFKPH